MRVKFSHLTNLTCRYIGTFVLTCSLTLHNLLLGKLGKKQHVFLAHVKEKRDSALKFVLESTLCCSTCLVYWFKYWTKLKRKKLKEKESRILKRHGNLASLQLEAITRCRGNSPGV